MRKKYLIMLAVLTAFLLLATISSVAQQQNSISTRRLISSEEAVIIPACDCGGCPGGPEFVDGEWRCVCAPCIPESEDAAVDELEIQAEEYNLEQVRIQLFDILLIAQKIFEGFR